MGEKNKYWNKFWTIPNALSLVRIASSIGIVATLVMVGLNPSNVLGLSLWTIITAGTDFIDGAIARKFNQQSKWGTFLDPVADKVLNWGIGIYMIASGLLPMAILTIGARDLIVAGVTGYDKYKNGVAKQDKKVSKLSFRDKIKCFKNGDGMTPTIFGKAKMLAQSIGVISALTFGYGTTNALSMISPVSMATAIGLCAFDLIAVSKNYKKRKKEYEIKNKERVTLPRESESFEEKKEEKSLEKEKNNIPLKVVSNNHYIKVVDEIIEQMTNSNNDMDIEKRYIKKM